MKHHKTMCGGVELTEFQMSQAFYEYSDQRARTYFGTVARRIDDALVHKALWRASRGRNTGWDFCFAVVNGQPMECYRIGRFTLLVDPNVNDKFSVAPRPKLGLVKRYALRLARGLRLA